jgi:hypothetical protein
MTDSIHQQMIGKVDTRLKTILKAGGYKTDAGQHVFDWLDRELADSELDAIIYRDKTKDIKPETLHNYEKRIEIEIEVKTKASTGTAKRLREMLEDVHKAIGTDDRWSNLAIDTQPVSEAMDIQRSDKISGMATLTIYIEYETEKWVY